MPNRFSSKGPSQRQLRAGEVVRHALADILQREELRDPDLYGVSVTVTEASVSPDLKNATVYCTPLGGADQEKVIAGLNRCAKFLRGRLSGAVDLKYTPTLKFVFDKSFEEASKVRALLDSPTVREDLGE